MAIAAPTIKPEDQEKQPQTGPISMSGGAPQTAPSAPSAGAPPQTSAPKATSSGRFTNISNYLRANQGFNQAQGGLAGKIGQNISQQAQGVKQNVQQAGQQFQQQAQGARVQYDPNVAQQAFSDPSAFAQNQANVEQFQKQAFSQYGGPQGLQDQDALRAQAQNVQSVAGQTASEGGRFNVLRQMFGRPAYSGGQQRLDNLLLQGNNNALSGARREATQAGRALNEQVNVAQAQAIGFKNEAMETNRRLQEQLGNTVTDFDTSLGDRVTAEKNARDLRASGLTTALGEKSLDNTDLKALGLSEGQSAMGLNLANYIKTNPNEVTRQNIASESDRMRAIALAKLAGQQADPELLRKLQGFDTAQPLGEAVTINKDQFQKDLAEKQTGFNKRKAELDEWNNRIQNEIQYYSRIGDSNARAALANLAQEQQSLNDQRTQLNQAYSMGDRYYSSTARQDIQRKNDLLKQAILKSQIPGFEGLADYVYNDAISKNDPAYLEQMYKTYGIT